MAPVLFELHKLQVFTRGFLMKVKYFNCYNSHKYDFIKLDNNTIEFLGETYYFDPKFIEYDDIIITPRHNAPLLVFSEIKRIENELFFTFIADKKKETPELFDGVYHDIS